MCGHGTMGVATVLVETGMVPVTEPVTTIRLDTPAGLVVAEVAVRDGHAKSVTLRKVPRFALALDQHGQVPGFGTVGYDIAYGGNFYAIVDLESWVCPSSARAKGRLLDAGLRDHGRHQRAEPAHAPGAPRHLRLPSRLPGRPGLDRPALAPRDGDPPRLVRPVTLRDRDLRPDGSAARAGRAGDREEFVNESFIGSSFRGRLLETTTVGGLPAVQPQVTGRAWVTGTAQYMLDPERPVPRRLPAVTRPRTADVVVVGAGAVGAACAYFMARAGLAVHVVERGADRGRHQQRLRREPARLGQGGRPRARPRALLPVGLERRPGRARA